MTCGKRGKFLLAAGAVHQRQHLEMPLREVTRDVPNIDDRQATSRAKQSQGIERGKLRRLTHKTNRLDPRSEPAAGDSIENLASRRS